MEPHDVERIVRGVLSDMAVPCTLATLNRNETGWQAVLKAVGGRVITLILPDGPPPAIRSALVQRLELEIDIDA
jgi:alpha-D-ribose 1-methylphosphonate 5-triphosphate synthase subunit PhnH